MKQYLFDSRFLKQIDYQENKVVYSRITLLATNDLPEQQIEGIVSGGSINIDGASAVRRSCNLTLTVDKTHPIITEEYWCYNHNFKLEIGLLNTVDTIKYPEILWFDQGIYVIASFSVSESNSGLSVSISGKDKMCRLNGEIGGNIPMETDFGTIEEVDEDGNVKITKIPLRTIIQQAVKWYGGEELHNIIINDLESYGLELWDYRGSEPMYLAIKVSDMSPKQTYFTASTKIKFNNKTIRISELENKGGKYYSLNTLDKDYNDDASAVIIGKTQYYIAKIEYGETAGYHATPLVYNGDLILKAGETVTSLLDKIKNMLGSYEYFYNLSGQFVFQKKKNFMYEVFNPLNQYDAATLLNDTSLYSYKFEDHALFTAISNPPNIANTKNDFAVWGKRKGVSGADLPIHVRFAIDKKPTKYTTLPWYDSKTKKLKQNSFTYTSNKYDWRELIYRMAIDYYRHGEKDTFLVDVQKLNPWCKDGKTGYEQYYIDLQAFWRQLYNPNPTAADVKQYGEFYTSGDDKYWNKIIHNSPTTINFWMDFLDTQGELGNYSVQKIGARSKVINENSVNSIYYKEIPEVLFVLPDDPEEDSQLNYTKILINDNVKTMFTRSSQGASAIDKANELLYEHTSKVGTISLTSMPIYYLQPNTRIFVKDYGEFTLDKISYSLNYNGTMNLNGTKINKQYI